MISMQYNIVLPGDYNMDTIKKRVKDNGSKTDGFPDLKMKAYLIAEKNKYGNYENQYAPFYLWRKEDGMNKFLLDGYFNNILHSFGWTKVKSWIVMHEYVKAAFEFQYAVIQRLPVTEFTDITAMCNDEKENFTEWIEKTATTAYITAYNPSSWEVCRFHMTADIELLKKVAEGSLIYDVHHVSQMI